MGKRSVGVLFLVLVLVFILIGCEEAKVYTYADFLGEWDLPNDTHISIMQDDDTPDKILDISWQEGLVEYFAMVDGTASGNVFTGTYVYNETTYADEDDDIGTFVYYGPPEKSVTITLTMYLDNPKLTCTGTGPLNGKVFSM